MSNSLNVTFILCTKSLGDQWAYPHHNTAGGHHNREKYNNKQLCDSLVHAKENYHIVGTDLHEGDIWKGKNMYTFQKGDMRTMEIANLIRKHRPEIIVHLAAIVMGGLMSPPRTTTNPRLGAGLAGSN